ncbi:DUF7737 domain-containing protein [Nonomuraea dietziae]|uniref:DUF7737 domain-containing protein n=1 Tax=Nonomuraea dietziae TaxID=65515 RepID=UPI003D9DFE51
MAWSRAGNSPRWCCRRPCATLPRLAVADRCALRERFLRLHGDLSTYKIHLGSIRPLPARPSSPRVTVIRSEVCARSLTSF